MKKLDTAFMAKNVNTFTFKKNFKLPPNNVQYVNNSSKLEAYAFLNVVIKFVLIVIQKISTVSVQCVKEI